VSVSYTHLDAVAHLRLDRPAHGNRITTGTVDALADALDRAHTENAAAIVLAGRGPDFCQGVEEPAAADRLRQILQRLPTLTALVIAAIQGRATGEGCLLALACDRIIVDAHGVFELDRSSVHLLPPLRRPRALRLAGHGMVGAERASELGVLTQRTAEGEHEYIALEHAYRVASSPWERRNR
jgi:2-(1,2-epoxy-1,2-dihydrophenyl)acetyl-CoA isomerase